MASLENEKRGRNSGDINTCPVNCELIVPGNIPILMKFGIDVGFEKNI